MGRPSVPSQRRRSFVVSIALSQGEYEEVQTAARLRSKSVSEYGRSALLDAVRGAGLVPDDPEHNERTEAAKERLGSWLKGVLTPKENDDA